MAPRSQRNSQRRAAAFSLALAIAALAPAAVDAAPRHPTKEFREPVAGSKVDAGVAHQVIHAGERDVLSLVKDFGSYKDRIPQFKRSQVIGRSGGSTDVYLQIPILHGAAKVWAVVRFDSVRTEGDYKVLSGSMVKGNVDRLDAEWRVRRIDDEHTELQLRLHLDPDLPFAGSVITDTLVSAAGRAVRGIRSAAED